MKFLSDKKGFLGIDNRNNKKENVVVVPFGLEKTVSYGGGTSKGPKEIIKASYQVELFDEDYTPAIAAEIDIDYVEKEKAITMSVEEFLNKEEKYESAA